MKHFFLFLIMQVIVSRCISQGCSDAGFCSLGPLKGVAINAAAKHSIDVGSNIGFGEQNTFSINPYIQYNAELSHRVSVQTKLTATYANGFLGSALNLGDVFGFVTYNAKKHSSNSLRLLAGIKIPLTSSNSKNDAGKPLPLDYQSSIGTYDFIAGLNYIIGNKIEFAAGLQAPVIQINKNTFFPEEYLDGRAMKFVATNNFRRKSDILIRGGYYIKLSSTLTIKPNLLAIYHLGKDTYQNRFGKTTLINGSEGLTLNGGLIATKQFKNHHGLELIAATPFIARDVRADGLTRKAAFTVQYSVPL